MERIIHDLEQGSDAWHKHRLAHFNASEAPAMAGISPYQSRAELLKQKATGFIPDVDADTQVRFANGHKFEAQARKWAEEIIGAPLSAPTVSCVIDGLQLSASYDGATADGDVIFEHKTLNASLASALDSGKIPDQYKPQMVQQMLILGARKCLFMASNGDKKTMRYAWYESDASKQTRLLAGWKQFEADLANYQHVEIIPAATATPVMALPALSIQVNGSITLIDNLKVFGEKLTAFIAGLDKNPETDQAFADAEQAIKTLEKAQTALEAAEAGALAQTASIDEMRRTVALYAGQARSTRLMLTKLVATRKETIRVEIVQTARAALTIHCDGLNKRLGKPYLPGVPEDFAGAIKGKKTVSSLHEAVDTELARCKIVANEIADRIHLNLIALRDVNQYHFLFADAAQIVLKAPDDLTALVKVRIADHVAAEAKRIESERERIRAEEVARLEREQQERDRAEAIAKETAAVQVQSPAASLDTQHETLRPEPALAAAPTPLADAETVLLNFKERFGHDKKFAGVTRAIIEYFKVQPKQKKAA